MWKIYRIITSNETRFEHCARWHPFPAFVIKISYEIHESYVWASVSKIVNDNGTENFFFTRISNIWLEGTAKNRKKLNFALTERAEKKSHINEITQTKTHLRFVWLKTKIIVLRNSNTAFGVKVVCRFFLYSINVFHYNRNICVDTHFRFSAKRGNHYSNFVANQITVVLKYIQNSVLL